MLIKPPLPHVGVICTTNAEAKRYWFLHRCSCKYFNRQPREILDIHESLDLQYVGHAAEHCLCARIIRFEESYAFFKKYPWVDKYRYITVLSASKIPFGEMALNNIAFSYGQLGNRKKARAYYKQTLAEYPNSEIAQVALNLLNAK